MKNYIAKELDYLDYHIVAVIRFNLKAEELRTCDLIFSSKNPNVPGITYNQLNGEFCLRLQDSLLHIKDLEKYQKMLSNTLLVIEKANELKLKVEEEYGNFQRMV